MRAFGMHLKKNKKYKLFKISTLYLELRFIVVPSCLFQSLTPKVKDNFQRYFNEINIIFYRSVFVVLLHVFFVIYILGNGKVLFCNNIFSKSNNV